ncbi:peptidoglycan-binding protein [Dankookia sp. GCM10030260]|uniref:peptidoglycan-binding protein n=1 Tax=Dankookia sp. GCM10030260 TaxID=3273390 RepID=UPI003614F3C3
MIPVDAHTMLEIAPRFSGANGERQAAIVAAVGEVLRPTLERYAIDTRLRIAHFLGQTCVEAAGFRTTEELADGTAYEGRKDLGNTEPGDGPRFKGRGLIQLTGRANYRSMGKALKLDLENNPAQAADPALSLVVACEYWKSRKINDAADQDDVIRVTKLINGGLNGLDERRRFTAKAKEALARLEGILVTGAQPEATRATLHRGAKGEAVAGLQRMLRGLGFALAVDGDFGAATELAVTQFQQAKGLDVDGVVGAKTWAALETAAG